MDTIKMCFQSQKYFDKRCLKVTPKDTNICFFFLMHKASSLHSFSGGKVRKVHILDVPLQAKDHHGQCVPKFTTEINK